MPELEFDDVALSLDDVGEEDLPDLALLVDVPDPS
jgi:hypothetical protein